MVLQSMTRVPINDGRYLGKITGELVDVQCPIVEEGVFITVSFPVDGEVLGIDIPAVIVVKDSYAVVHLED
jgi:hypothetical protein